YQNIVTGFGSTERRTLRNMGYVADYFLDMNGTTGFGAAIRYDDNSRFRDVFTYRLQASHMFISGTRIRAAAGTGVKNPTNTELFGFNAGTFIGNPNLKPEKSRGWEIGLEQNFLEEQVDVGATYFNSTLKDQI